HRAHQIARQGTGRLRHPGQRGDPGGGENRDLRPAHATAHRLHAVENPEEPLCAGGGAGRHGGVALIRRLRVLDRRGVRHLGWTGDLLKPSYAGSVSSGQLVSRAGTPTAVHPAGTSAVTTAAAPILAKSPTLTSPSTVAP